MRWREWQVLRNYILERDKHACVRCGEHEQQLQVDHLLPKYEYPEHEADESNLQALCLKCHQSKGIEEDRFLQRLTLLTKKEKKQEEKRFIEKQREKQRFKNAISE